MQHQIWIKPCHTQCTFIASWCTQSYFILFQSTRFKYRTWHWMQCCAMTNPGWPPGSGEMIYRHQSLYIFKRFHEVAHSRQLLQQVASVWWEWTRLPFRAPPTAALGMTSSRWNHHHVSVCMWWDDCAHVYQHPRTYSMWHAQLRYRGVLLIRKKKKDLQNRIGLNSFGLGQKIRSSVNMKLLIQVKYSGIDYFWPPVTRRQTPKAIIRHTLLCFKAFLLHYFF